MRPRKNISGKRFGKLIVIRLSHLKNHKSYWECLCDCGNKKIIRGNSLINGNTMSCGCLPRQNKLPFEESALNRIITRYRRGAKKRGLEFILTRNEFQHLVSQPCFYCGSTPNQVEQTYSGHGFVLHNGIDRINSSLGYTNRNCVPCCGICNRAKHSMSQEDFLDWLYAIYQYLASGCNNISDSKIRME